MIRGRGGLVRQSVVGLLLCLGASSPIQGQEIGSSLSLDEAVRLARENNPNFLMAANNQGAAEWGKREAYAAFLPTVNSSLSGQYLAPGIPSTGIYSGEDFGIGSTDYYFSGYNLNLGYTLSGSTFFEVGSAKANLRATEAGIRAAEYNLESAVTAQYLIALRARDAVEVARRQLERAAESMELAQARVEVGAVIPTDGKQAEVEEGRARVQLIEAESLFRSEKLRLVEQLGVRHPGDFELVSEFGVFLPFWNREELVDRAMAIHPQLRAYQAQESAGIARVRQAWSSYFPNLFLQATWSGRAREIGDTDYLLGQYRDGAEGSLQNCQFLNQVVSGLSGPVTGYPRDCSNLGATPQREALILAGNDVFPFDFRKEPLSLYVQLSFPVFQGLSRGRQMQEAKAMAEDARFNRRAEELRLETAVTQAYDELSTAVEVVEIEERNREVADEQLDLAQERYGLGAATFLELLEAQSSVAAAERDFLNARYRFHGALWALEASVGERLRPESGSSQ
ncbi:MAG: TolC family protein [Gemmatimonadota bacterium]